MKKIAGFVFLALAVVAVLLFQSPQTAMGGDCSTYNNTRPGGFQGWAGVDSVEIRPNLRRNGAQLWLHEDGRWDSQGGKFSLFFPSNEALGRYCSNPHPSPAELRRLTERENLCPSSIGKGQRWLPFD